MFSKFTTVDLSLITAKNTYPKSEKLKGVYVWGYESDKTFIPLYVGKSAHLYERLLQHYCRFKSGEYRLRDRNNQLVYEPKSMYDVLFEIKKIPKYLNDRAQHFVFKFIQITEEHDRQEFEKFLSEKIGPNKLISTVKGKYNPKHKTKLNFEELCK